MRILLTSTRGAGHVRPLLPYAATLATLGHDILIAAPEDVRPIAEKAGIRFQPFGKLRDEEINRIWAEDDGDDRDKVARIGIGQLFANRTARAAMPKLEEILQDWHPDFVLRESVEFAGFVLAEKHHVPHARVAVHNGQTENMICTHGQESINALLAEQGVQPKHEHNLWAEQVFTAFPAVFDGTADHPKAQQPFRVNVLQGETIPTSEWVPETDLPKVYITFGTVVGGKLFNFREVFEAAIESVRGLDAEVLMTTGPNVDVSEFKNVPENLDIRQFVPQSSVLNHVQAVVFHGGSGTLTGALAAGVPMVVIPLFADQPMNAERVDATGLGRSVVERTPETIKAALVEVLSNSSFSERAKSAADEMENLPDLFAASHLIEELAAN